MALSRVKTWISGEVLTASDLNAEFNNILNNPSSLITPIGFNLTFTDATYDIGASGATRPRDLFLSRNATIGGDVTLSGGQMGGFYQWTNWNPADVAGTNTNAPGTGTATANANFVAFSNSSGTVTATVAKVGKYRVRVSCGQSHAAAYTDSPVSIATPGGTATILTAHPAGPPISVGEPSTDQNHFGTAEFVFNATAASQTITIQPVFTLTGSGAAANHTAYANLCVDYLGA